MFLVDSNVFLEILLKQEKKDKCKRFLSDNIDELYITDFSLHSIGVVLFKYGNEKIFVKLVEDVLPNVKVIALPVEQYVGLGDIKKNHNLDFDDAYQYLISKHYNLKIVTMDLDFKKVKDLEIVFL